ncbi:MAG: hypothetical protein QOJ07_3917 [Thermoleophilaceae bacterium]|jgi:hypothetical protein|nr:hypothetical protein [Thermoleophilaceae bacterium]
MGKRSRKRSGTSADLADAEVVAARPGSTRAERDAARARRASVQRKAAENPDAAPDRQSRAERRRRAGRPTIDERPPAPWGSFPLVELMVLASLIMLVVGGIFTQGDTRKRLILAALAVGSLAGLELSIREHFAGYRSHTTLLAGVVTFVAMLVVLIAAGSVLLGIVAIVGVLCFAISFYLFRRAFKRRTGGLGFR